MRALRIRITPGLAPGVSEKCVFGTYSGTTQCVLGAYSIHPSLVTLSKLPWFVQLN